MVQVAPTFGPWSSNANSVVSTWVPNGDTPLGYRIWVNPFDLRVTIDVDLAVFTADPSVGGWGGRYTWTNLPSDRQMTFIVACVYPGGVIAANSFQARTLPSATAPVEPPPPPAGHFRAAGSIGGAVELTWDRVDAAAVKELFAVRLGPEVRLFSSPGASDPGRFTDHVGGPGDYTYMLRTIAPHGAFTDVRATATVVPAPAPMPHLPGWSERRGIGMSHGVPIPAMTAVSWGPNRIDAAWSSFQDFKKIARSAWTGAAFESQPGPAGPGDGSGDSPAIGTMALSSLGPGHLDFLYAHPGTGPWHRWWNGQSWTAPENLGWGTINGLCAVGWPASDQLHVFYTTASGGSRLLHRRWSGGAWSGEEDWGGTVQGRPTAASWGEGRLDVFYRSPANHLMHQWLDNGARGAEEDLGDSLTCDPAAVADRFGSLHVFYNSGGRLVDRRWNTSGHGWDRPAEPLDHTATGPLDEKRAPAVASWGPGRVDVFFVRFDQGAVPYVYHMSYR
ncbi:MAG: hypothetical protein HOZ81_22795 [Streptomyces sp.]|nr:hypothetical protein [Streptomyces sp.]